jgi:short-subunit dehydrogenase
LGVKLEKSGVTVTALCPGSNRYGLFSESSYGTNQGVSKNKVMAPQEVAKLGYEALMRGDPVFIPGGIRWIYEKEH